MTTLPAKLSTLEQEISVLSERLRPVDDDFIAAEIRPLLEILPFPSSMNPAAAPAAYAFALKGVSRHGLRIAVRKVIRGEYDKLNRSFMPSPPELAALARREIGTTVDDLVRAKEIRAAMTPEVDATPPAERARQIARVKEMAADFKRDHEASKVRETGTPVADLMSDERRARLAKIMDMPERADINAEEREFARRTAADITAEGRDNAA